MLEAGPTSGWSGDRFIPHGGHHLAVAAAAAFGLGGAEVYPTKFQPFSVATSTLRSRAAVMPLPDVPGLGLELRPDLAAILNNLDARRDG